LTLFNAFGCCPVVCQELSSASAHGRAHKDTGSTDPQPTNSCSRVTPVGSACGSRRLPFLVLQIAQRHVGYVVVDPLRHALFLF
jgi:hypothetical protein